MVSRTQRQLLLCLSGVAIILAGTFWSTPAHAAEVSVSLAPVPKDGIARNVFDLVAEPGSTIQDTAEIRNSSSEAAKVFVFTSGFEVRDGKVQPVIATPDMEPDPGLWITLDKTELIIPANGTAKVNFTIKVPEKLDVGEHQATLFTQGQSLAAPTTNASGFTIVIRNGVRVYMVVPGQIDRTLNIKKIRHRIQPLWSLFGRKLFFVTNFENKGNITLRPKTNITVRGLFGKVGEMKDVEFVKIGRGQTQTGEALWYKRPPLFGRFVADFEIHLGQKEQVNEDRTRTMLPDEVINKRYVFWVFPWIFLLYLLLLALLLYFIRSIYLYFVIAHRLKVKTDIYVVKSGDNLIKIASKLGVDPTVLAKFNFLPWPYNLSPGDKLLVPTGKLSNSEWKDRVRSIVSKEFFSGVLIYFFRRRAVQDVSHQLEGITSKPKATSKDDYEILVAEKGDTIQDVADFAGVDKAVIIRINKLKSPYKLKSGQEIKVPRKGKKKK